MIIFEFDVHPAKHTAVAFVTDKIAEIVVKAHVVNFGVWHVEAPNIRPNIVIRPDGERVTFPDAFFCPVPFPVLEKVEHSLTALTGENPQKDAIYA